MPERFVVRRRLIGVVLVVAVAAGWTSWPAAARPGVLDPGFGNGQVVRTDVDHSGDQARAIGVQSGGQVVVAGMATRADNYQWQDTVVARYTPSGTLDPTFGHGGLVTGVFADRAKNVLSAGAEAMVIQKDDKIVTAGLVGTGDTRSMGVLRLNPDGSFDQSFGQNGRVILPLGGNTTLLLGTVLAEDSAQRITVSYYEDGLRFRRLTSTGAVDATFAPSAPPADLFAPRSMLTQPDGKLLVAGRVDPSGRQVRRYNPDGSVDPTWTVTDIPDDLHEFGYAALALQPDGRVVAVTTDSKVTDTGTYRQYTDMVVARFTSSGSLDPSFSGDGVAYVGFCDCQDPVRTVAESVFVQPDGAVVVAGVFSSGVGAARLSPSGQLDPTFGTAGLWQSPWMTDALAATAGPNGTMLLAGGLGIGAEQDLAVAELDLGPTGSGGGSPSGPGPSGPSSGYWMVGSDGAVFGFGSAHTYGNAPTTSAADLEPTPSGQGYWIVDEAGRVFAFGDATLYGNADPAVLARGEKVTSLSATPSGKGYWMFTSRGRVLTFGDAPFLGDVSQLALAGPVLDSTATPSGRGYYMVASDGGIFAFGDAAFFGSMGGRRLNAPVQSLVPDSDGAGYWLVASDGGIFAFQAEFHGSMGATRLNRPVTGMVRAGHGYLMVGEDGGIFDFSGTPDGFQGSLGSHPPAHPIVAVALAG